MTDNNTNSSSNSAHGTASLPASTASSVSLPDPDEDYADLKVDDPTVFTKPGKDGKEGESSEYVPHYILGTLVVRVVAARDLEPVGKGGITQMVFGSGRARASGGMANPYACVRFGNTTQRTSEVFDTLDPIWPRQETMFMDVSLPLAEVTHPEPTDSTTADTAVLPTESDADSGKAPTLLTVALFHTPEIGNVHKFPTKGVSGDSNDMFLGMASIDLTRILTGIEHTFDGWLRLTGTETSRGSVRIVCEYEASDPPPRPGDFCGFTRYCDPVDLYPLQPGRQYRVNEVEGDTVLMDYTTAEGWVCTFQAHRFMLICQERHQSRVEAAQDELVSLAERLSYSPLVHSITDTVDKVAEDGIISVGENVAQEGISLLERWLSGGLGTVVSDVAHATNWDGRYNPNVGERLDIPSMSMPDLAADPAASKDSTSPKTGEALPNMPCCPITGEPMADPAVAADGHTYERSAIARWLTTSNKSPMTGAILTHKELVTNYGLLSSVADAAQTTASGPKVDSPEKPDDTNSLSLTPATDSPVDPVDTNPLYLAPPEDSPGDQSSLPVAPAMGSPENPDGYANPDEDVNSSSLAPAPGSPENLDDDANSSSLAPATGSPEDQDDDANSSSSAPATSSPENPEATGSPEDQADDANSSSSAPATSSPENPEATGSPEDQADDANSSSSAPATGSPENQDDDANSSSLAPAHSEETMETVEVEPTVADQS